MSYRVISPARSPAGRALLAFGTGGLITAACMVGFAFCMIKQGLSQSAAWPLATFAVSAGSLCSGWLMAFLQKGRGLLCGLVQGGAYALLLLGFSFASGSLPEGLALLRLGMVLVLGGVGGILGMLRAERKKRITRS